MTKSKGHGRRMGFDRVFPANLGVWSGPGNPYRVRQLHGRDVVARSPKDGGSIRTGLRDENSRNRNLLKLKRPEFSGPASAPPDDRPEDLDPSP